MVGKTDFSKVPNDGYNALESDIADVPYTFMSNDQFGNRVGSNSKIDHFLISPSLKNSVKEYKTLLEYTNGSDHVPLLSN